MEVGQGPNVGCSAKEKKRWLELLYEYESLCNELRLNRSSSILMRMKPLRFRCAQNVVGMGKIRIECCYGGWGGPLPSLEDQGWEDNINMDLN
jgi:hypothetical protein